jgi:hypothetical protein
LLIRSLFCGLVTVSTVLADDQPQWGQRYSRNMVSDETGLPETFDPATGKNIKWVVPLGTETYSTPVVSGGKVLIGTSCSQAHTLCVPGSPQSRYLFAGHCRR